MKSAFWKKLILSGNVVGTALSKGNAASTTISTSVRMNGTGSKNSSTRMLPYGTRSKTISETIGNAISGRRNAVSSMISDRPTACLLYTSPSLRDSYQAVLTEYEHHLIYNRIDKDCNFERMEIEDYPETDTILLSIDGETHPYLLLNHWVKEYESQSIDGYKMLGKERLSEYFRNRASTPDDKKR